jgi:hypothetical protein
MRDQGTSYFNSLVVLDEEDGCVVVDLACVEAVVDDKVLWRHVGSLAKEAVYFVP